MTETPDIDTPSLPPLATLRASGRGKVVLQHTTGPMAGMMRIMGNVADAPDPLPDFIPEVDMLSHHAPVGIIGIKRSYVLYREVMDPEMNKMFDEAQQ